MNLSLFPEARRKWKQPVFFLKQEAEWALKGQEKPGFADLPGKGRAGKHSGNGQKQ